MDALRAESLFGRELSDDVNVGSEAGDVDEDTNVSDEEHGVPSAFDSYGSDIESESNFQDESQVFEQGDSMHMLGTLGRRTFDEHHCGELQLSGADDLYSGSWGPTRSAPAFALSSLGMFFYFLPKKLRIHIENETNDYRE
ncbi:Hypothetical protein PHPALM_14473 [Phytophthora palmivora]|uniref:Uncharacterized protein n=1 Tax=Phytophthora palmivora TaxID=4796 RepID=A0A2P4XUM6_9STRA|nr:Hypothetical protein PHPALM_14473 [Phytophthora palmivora]